MPSELALLPFVESSFDPWALSRSQASGLWQFVPATGRGYNLKQDWWRDERRDPIASTNAALDYLQYLFEFHGDWHLALASYNWGEGSVKRAIEKKAGQGMPTDYLSLDMPDETRNYVPKLQAIKNIIANPAKFSIVLPTIDKPALLRHRHQEPQHRREAGGATGRNAAGRIQGAEPVVQSRRDPGPA